MKLLVTYISLCFLFALMVSLSVVTEKKQLTFTVPQGWPKPVYDFSKNPVTEEGFALGKKLFFEPLLSRDTSIACSSCHAQFSGFTHIDHTVSHGIDGLKGKRNSLTLFNLAWSKNFMWDGGVNNLEVQPLNPLTSPFEMDNKLDVVLERLNHSPYYRNAFKNVFGDSVITGQRVLKALTQYVVMLQSNNSKYDKVMRKEPGVEFSTAEKEGLRLFRLHCASCHKEPLFTDFSFKNNGLPVDPELNDYGRMVITKNAKDSLKFKVPSLRNIEVSYPYMHDGRFKRLNGVLDHYTGGIQPGKTLSNELKKKIVLSEEDKKNIIAFLYTLTDKEFLTDKKFRSYRVSE